MSRLASGNGDIVVQVNGDSTGNEVTDWVYLWCQSMGAAYPNLAIDYRVWNDATQGYDPVVSIQAGTAPSPGIVFQDTFTRTASDLYLSTPDIGAVWGRDGSNAAGDWVLDGSKAVRTADATSGNVLADGNTPGDIKLTVVGTISTVATGSSYTTQFTLKRLSSTSRIVLTITISTTGSVTWAIAKVINGTSTTIGSTTSLTALATNVANQPFTLVYQVVGLTVSATIGASTLTATLLQSDADLLDPATASAVVAHPSTAMTMDTYTMELVAPAQPQKMTVYNCSVPGSNLSYQQPRIASIAPVAPDLVLINTGHNYSTNTPAQYATALDSFLSDYLSAFPNTGLLITSQNPQKAPSANRIFHSIRQTSLRAYCAKRGIGYVPLFETWVNEPDGGVSMISTDGVHPVLSGSQFWANYVTTCLINGGIYQPNDADLTAIAGLNTTGFGRSYLTTEATGAIAVPSGTTAQRPSSPVAGSQRWNTDTLRNEFFASNSWQNHVRLSGDTMTGDLYINPSGVPVPEFVAGTTLGVSSAGASGQVSCQLVGFGAAPQYYGVRAQGSPASPSALDFAGFNLFVFASAGYHSGNAWSTPQNFVQLLTAQPWTATAQGTTAQISTTPNGTTASVPRIIVNQSNVELRGSSGVVVRNQDGSGDGQIAAGTLTATAQVVVPSGNATQATTANPIVIGTNLGLYNHSDMDLAITRSNSTRARIGNNGVSLTSGGVIQFSNSASDASATASFDALLLRNAAGQIDVRANSGLRVRHGSNAFDAPVFASFAGLTAVNALQLQCIDGALATRSMNLLTEVGREQCRIDFIKRTADLTRNGNIAFVTYSGNVATNAMVIDSTAQGVVSINYATGSSSPSTGALVVSGGVGVGGSLSIGSTLFLGVFTVASLPPAATSNGASAQVTDSTLDMTPANYGTAVVGGGSNRVRLFCRNSTWIIA